MENLYYLTICLIIFSIFILSLWYAGWSVHKEMTESNCNEWGYGSYKEFKSEYTKIDEWEQGRPYIKSHFHRDSDSEIHASIVRFNGKGMVLYPWSYPLYVLFLHQNKYNNYNKELWNY